MTMKNTCHLSKLYDAIRRPAQPSRRQTSQRQQPVVYLWYRRRTLSPHQLFFLNRDTCISSHAIASPLFFLTPSAPPPCATMRRLLSRLFGRPNRRSARAHGERAQFSFDFQHLLPPFRAAKDKRRAESSMLLLQPAAPRTPPTCQ